MGAGGGALKAVESADRLRECDNDKEGGAPKCEYFAVVIRKWSLSGLSPQSVSFLVLHSPARRRGMRAK